MERDLEYLANLETLDNGKPFTFAQGDIGLAAKNIRYYAGWTDKIHGDTIPVGKSSPRALESFLLPSSSLINS
jgi:acyl-CoA reductase-like NAD-dependent aldehyde dehydrogenase